MAEYQIKFMFADATTMDESFDAGVTVLDAKQRMIANWPEGRAAILLLAVVSLAALSAHACDAPAQGKSR